MQPNNTRAYAKPILVVDDDPRVLEVACAILESRGWAVARATGASSALQAARASEPDVGPHRPSRELLRRLTSMHRRPPLRARRQLLGRHEQGDGDGKVEARPALADARRRQVHRDALLGPGQPRRGDGGAHPVACLATRRVGQAHDGEPGEAGRHVDLDGDGPALDAEQRGGRNSAQHSGLLPQGSMGRAPTPSTRGVARD